MEEPSDCFRSNPKTKRPATMVETVRIFLSSPGDVADERGLARQVLRRLGKERQFREKVRIEDVSWDDPDDPVTFDAHYTPQEAIDLERPKPSECDVVAVILWSRLGTPLRDEYRKPDGTAFRSGTEWEFLNAVASAKPAVWLYRRTEKVYYDDDDPDFDEKRAQRQAVKDFLGEFREENGALKRSFTDYGSPGEFAERFERNLRDWLTRRLEADSGGKKRRRPPPDQGSRKGNEAAVAHLAELPELPELPRYREAAIRAHEKLPITGFATKARVSIQLDELYVPLRAMLDTRTKGDCGFADAKDAEERLGLHNAAEIPLIDAFRAAEERRRHGLVILGDPGSGKTTQLKRLLLACLRESPENLGLPAGTIPVFLPLRDLEDLDRGVDAFIETTLDSPHLDMGKGFGRRLLDRGNLLLLFDGLDEVSDPAQRAKVSRWIEDLARHRPSCFPVVTCRFAGYGDEARLGPEFLELHLRPLTPEQSEEFIRNWYRVVTTCQTPGPAALADAAAEAGALIERLREPEYRSARMAEMTRNPLLLANLCLVHYDRKGILPKGRHELYEECIEVLLELWRRDKKLTVRVPARTGRDLLGPVALWLHGQEGRSRASLAELTPVLEPAIEKAQWPGDAAGFLRAVRDESGLLTGWSGDRYGFMHLGFQEYLAAMEIRRRVLDDLVAGRAPAALAELAGHYGESWWQEVILLLLAQGDPPLFEPFMKLVFCLPRFPLEDELLRFILEEAAETSLRPFEEFLKQEWIDNPAEDRAKLEVIRAMAEATSDGDLLALLDEAARAFERSSSAPEIIKGWARRRLSVKRESIRVSASGGVELVAIPGGRFLMGSAPGVGYDDERPQHEVEIRSFYLGRYPVTNAEYRRYLEANPGAKEPQFWADRRFNQDRQPVVGVDWKEARRFCEWAGGRLPTEAEWEYACRAGTATAWHWGDDDTQAAAFAWFAENWGNGGNQPVGEKRPNPWGLHDLTGNVWEWTEDAWHPDYEGAPADGSAWTQDGGGVQMVRGGSWVASLDHLRSAFRYGYYRDLRNTDLGFRLVLAEALPGS
jgi:formylglycine-generating enzyme required for sulfatase activity